MKHKGGTYNSRLQTVWDNHCVKVTQYIVSHCPKLKKKNNNDMTYSCAIFRRISASRDSK